MTVAEAHTPRSGKWQCTQCGKALENSLEIEEHLGLRKGTLPEKLCEWDIKPEDIVFQCSEHKREEVA